MYYSYLSNIQKDQVLKTHIIFQLKIENCLYRQEIDDYKASRCIDGILDQYQRKFEFVNEQGRLLKNNHEKITFKPPNLLNAAIFMKNHIENSSITYITNMKDNKYENMIKWTILDSCVRDLHPNKISILQNDGRYDGVSYLC